MTPPRVRLNDQALEAARALIAAGAVDREGWANLEDVDLAPFLQGEPPSWERVARVHLGLVVGQDRATPGAYAYPMQVEPGRLSRALLIQARVKAVHLGHPPIFEAATELLKAVDGTGARVTVETYAMAGGVALGPAIDVPMFLPVPTVQPVQILPWGEAQTNDGRPLLVDQRSVRLVNADLEARDSDLVIDFNHGTWMPQGDPAAAGWMMAFEWRVPAEGQPTTSEHGLWATTAWTYRGRRSLEDREFRHISPAVLQEVETGLVVKLRNAALVNQPNIRGMLPAAASEHTEHAAAAAAVSTPAIAPPLGAARGPAINPETAAPTVPKEDDSMDLTNLLAALGYKSPEEAVASVKDLQTRVASLETDLKAKTAETATLSEKLAAQELAARLERVKAANLQGDVKTFAESLAKDHPDMLEGFLSLHTTRPKSGRLPVTPVATPSTEAHTEDPVAHATEQADPERQQLHREVLAYAEAHKVKYGDAYEAVTASKKAGA